MIQAPLTEAQAQAQAIQMHLNDIHDIVSPQKSSRVPENSESAANDSHGCNIFFAFLSSKGHKMTPTLCVKLAVCNSAIALYNTVVFIGLFGMLVCYILR